MSKLHTTASIVIGILATQAVSPASGEEGAPEPKSNQAQPSRFNISGATAFAPVKNETKIGILLHYRSVQREIGLTDEQAKKIDAIYNSQFERHLPVLMALRDNFKKPEKRAELQAQLDLMIAGFAKEIKAQLRPDQARRLTQISVQNAGLRAHLMPEVVEALNLSPDQHQAIQETIAAMKVRESQLQVEVREKDVQAFANFPGRNWEEFQKSKSYVARHEKNDLASESNRALARREISRLLTRRQNQKFNDFLGLPFDPEKHRRPDDPRSDAK